MTDQARPRIRFLQMDIGGTFTEIVSRPAPAGQLDLAPHPKGGWGDSIRSSHLRADPENHPPTRVSATALSTTCSGPRIAHAGISSF